MPIYRLMHDFVKMVRMIVFWIYHIVVPDGICCVHRQSYLPVWLGKCQCPVDHGYLIATLCCLIVLGTIALQS